jgi:hypothetical protein
MTMESMKSMPLSPKQAMTFGFINALVMNAVLAWLIGVLGITSFGAAIQPLGIVWLGFVATNTVGDWLWKGRPFGLFLFNSAYQILSLAIAAAILVSL